MEKSSSFLYPNNELSEGETKETIPFKITSKIINYLKINLNKEVKDLYNYKILVNEIEDETNKWKDNPCEWIARSNTIKMSILLKAIDKLNAVSIKIPITFFTKLEQTITKFV